MRLARIAAGWITIVGCCILGLLLIGFGWIHDGWAPPATQCLHGPVPELGGPFYEQTEVTGERSYFPLGVLCTYDVPGDDYGPQTVHNYKLVPTALLVASGLGIPGGALLVRGRPKPRRV